MDEPNIHGLFVGIDKYMIERRNLYGCANDAIELSKAFAPTLVTNMVLIDADATRHAILDNIDRILTQCDPGDLFLLFVACHGSDKYGEFFLEPHDHDQRTFVGKALLFQDIANMLGAHHEVNTLVVIDACQAGAIGFDPARHNRGQLSSIMAASAPLEPSQEYDSDDVVAKRVPQRHGKFAYNLMLQIKRFFADDGPGVATITQIFDNAYGETKNATDNQQHPVMVGTLSPSLTLHRRDL